MNPIFLSFLKSMQTKSQDAQNPGLWVNGMRQPMHENSRLRFDRQQAAKSGNPKAKSDAEEISNRNKSMQEAVMGGIVKPLINAIAKPVTNKVTNKGAEFTNSDTGKALGDAYMSRWQERRDDEDKGIDHENEAPVDYRERETEKEDNDNFVGPPSKLSGHNLWKKKEPMQENTNRSMFLTHLQGMQTKSQDAQNPGLWVNGNRLINPNS